MSSKPLNIGMIGYGFMGRAHSNAYAKVNHFFDLAYRPVLKEKSGKIAEVIIHAPRPAPPVKDVPDKGIPPAPVIPPADGSVQSLLGPPASK